MSATPLVSACLCRRYFVQVPAFLVGSFCGRGSAVLVLCFRVFSALGCEFSRLSYGVFAYPFSMTQPRSITRVGILQVVVLVCIVGFM